MAYQSGAYTPASWRLDGAGADTTCKMLKSDMNEEGTELVKRISGNLGMVERYAGFFDTTFTVTLLFDSTIPPAGIGFKFGNKGTIRWAVEHTGTSASAWAHAHVMVRKISFVNNVDDLIEFTVDLALDASANANGQSSPFVYPS